LATLDRKTFGNLKEVGTKAREIMLHATLPADLVNAIKDEYRVLGGRDNEVAVRSSATAEDLPQASFAGQHESYLNVKGEEHLLAAIKKCFALTGPLNTAKTTGLHMEKLPFPLAFKRWFVPIKAVRVLLLR
jgi:phosphoenolpyruvate synthase/pyruvate phosphate dikinase